MTQKQMIEFIKEHHPNESDTKIRILLQSASDDFLTKTQLIKGSLIAVTDSNDNFELLGPGIGGGLTEINRIEVRSGTGPDYEYEQIQRIGNIPTKTKEMT